MRNTPYALRTYLQTYDNTVSKYVPLDLFPDQVSLIEDYDTHNENIALKYRQAGVSTVTAAWASKKVVFANKQNNFFICQASAIDYIFKIYQDFLFFVLFLFFLKLVSTILQIN